jgi:excisionase family DNA binding protein
MNSQIEPPARASYELEEALELLAALEDARDAVAATDHLSVLAQVEHEIAQLSRKLDLDRPLEAEMATELLTASEAARRLGMPTKDLLRLVHDRKIRYVMVKGIAHIPNDALEDYRAKAS